MVIHDSKENPQSASKSSQYIQKKVLLSRNAEEGLQQVAVANTMHIYI